MHLPGVLESLRAGSAALGKLNLRSLYWGIIETCNTHQQHEPNRRDASITCSSPHFEADRMCASRLSDFWNATYQRPVGYGHVRATYISTGGQLQRSILSLAPTHRRCGRFLILSDCALCRGT